MGGRAGRGRRHRPAGPRRLDHYRARYQAIIDEGWRANPPPATARTSGDRAGRRRRSKAASLLARLDDHREQVRLRARPGREERDHKGRASTQT